MPNTSMVRPGASIPLIPPSGFGYSWVLLLWAAWYLIAIFPVAGIPVTSFRWEVAGALGLIGIYWYIVGPYRGARPITQPAILLLLLSAGSSLYAGLPLYAFLRSGGLALVLLFAIFGIGARFGGWNDLRRIFFALLVLYLIGSLLMVYHGISAGAGFFGDPDQRFQATPVLKATGAGTFIVCALPFLAWCIKYQPGYRRTALLVLFAALLALLFATKSRGAIGAGLVVMPLTISFLRGSRISHGMWLATILLMVAGVVVTESDTVAHALRLDRGDITGGRAERWSDLLALAWEKPLFGHGFGMSRYYYLDPHELIAGWSLAVNTRVTQVVAHNEHVTVFYELGLVGLLCYWTTLGITLRSGYRVIRAPSGPWRDMVLVIGLSWLGRFFDTFTHDPHLTVGNPNAYAFWLQMLVVCIGSDLIVKRGEGGSVRTPTSSYQLFDA